MYILPLRSDLINFGRLGAPEIGDVICTGRTKFVDPCMFILIFMIDLVVLPGHSLYFR